MPVDGVNPNPNAGGAQAPSGAQEFQAAADRAQGGDGSTASEQSALESAALEKQLLAGGVLIGQLVVVPFIQDILKK